MRILFATPVPPVLNKPRPNGFVRGLARRGHQVHLITQVSSSAEASSLGALPGWSDLEEACETISIVAQPKVLSVAQCALSLPTTVPLRVAYVRSRSFVARARELVVRHSCDLVHVDRERLAPAFRGFDVPKVLDATDSIALYVRRALKHGPPGERALSAVELLKVPRFERRMARGYQASIVTSDEDAEAIAQGGGAMPVVVPNGVGDAYFECARRPEPDRIVFMGTMSYAPNVEAAIWFVRHVFPTIRRERPSARVAIVGHKPSRSVVALDAEPGVDVTGTVPDVLPYLSSATVHVAPMRIGGGFPNKVAEALAAGVPTVSTRAGCAGIAQARDGTHLLVANDPEDFASAVLRVLAEPDLQRDLSAEGRRLMQRDYLWGSVVDRLEDVYEKALGSVPGTARRPAAG